MENYVIKRNGQYEPFKPFKIEDAIKKGFASANISLDETVFTHVLKCLEEKTTWTVEEIQDRIEKTLFCKGYFECHAFVHAL